MKTFSIKSNRIDRYFFNYYILISELFEPKQEKLYKTTDIYGYKIKEERA